MNTLEADVEALLYSCAITKRCKGFYPLRDMILMLLRGEIPLEEPTRAVLTLPGRYGTRYMQNMRSALIHAWKTQGSHIRDVIGARPEAPYSSPTQFLLAAHHCIFCRRLAAWLNEGP